MSPTQAEVYAEVSRHGSTGSTLSHIAHELKALPSTVSNLLAVLVLANPQRRAARIVFVSPAGERTSVDLPVRGYPGSIGWVSRSRLALLYPDLPRAAVFETGTGLPESLAVAPSRYPLKSDAAHRLCRGSVAPVQVAAYRAGRPRPPRPLHPISLADYAATGRAGAAEIIDAGATGTVWHRLVVEGDFPPGTGATIHLSAADATGALDDAPASPPPFRAFGARAGDVARGGWVEDPSGVPFPPGELLPSAQAPRDRVVEVGGRDADAGGGIDVAYPNLAHPPHLLFHRGCAHVHIDQQFAQLLAEPGAVGNERKEPGVDRNRILNLTRGC